MRRKVQILKLIYVSDFREKFKKFSITTPETGTSEVSVNEALEKTVANTAKLKWIVYGKTYNSMAYISSHYEIWHTISGEWQQQIRFIHYAGNECVDKT